MPKFAANLSLLFTERSFLERFAAAARAGFRAVEFQFPYDHDKDAVAETLSASGLVAVLHNLPPGDWSTGERGIACHPDRTGEFQDGVGKAIGYARALGCQQLNCLVGLTRGLAEQAHQTLVDNLTFAATALEREGIRLLIEPINDRDMPGFHLTRIAQASEIIDAVGSGNLLIQFDAYHVTAMGDDPVRTMEAHLPRIGHVQIADHPGRHEPGTGEIDFRQLFERLDRLGYRGWVGCEYNPAGVTEDGLGWLEIEARRP
ncbi:hydroxypyruvate isomerase [Inquilinus sp. CAU 1745]|uniref:hydroxypyruvate isomerase n=1 Tax=Inquilinus sp. CAU 1745 TaxID=3140369 RepID=UPI00325ACC1B